ncbi:MAG: family 43 glycosylhydrolase [Chitinispirillaceae bacterium]|nr:family 43 glycosylhydrolase [Chitinispirillaceae bacterium]
MKKTIASRAAVLIATCMFGVAVHADNCFINGSSVPLPHPTADPAPTVFTYNGKTKVYFYTTQDIIGGSGTYPIDTIHCYSSEDMFHWKDEGVSLDEDRVPWANHNVHKLWAPHVVYLKGKYRLTVPATHTDGYFYNFMATCDNPVGPYIAGNPLPGSVRNVIDPFVFIDPTDSTVWMSYRHQNGSALGFVQMNDSATRITGDINNCIQNPGSGTPSGYREGTWMWKRGNMYYLVFAQVPGSGNEIIAYSTATNRNGPWTYRGQIFSQNNSPSEFTIHSGACEFKGQTYIFHHGLTFGGQIFGTERCSAIEYLTYNADGTIYRANATTGIPKTNRGVGVPNAYSDSIQVDRGVITGAASAAWSYNANTTEAKASWYVTNIANNATVRYDSVDFTPPAGHAGPTSMMVRVAGTGTGTIIVRVGSATATPLGTINITATGNKTSWATQTGNLANRTTGRHNLFLTFTTSGTNTYDINWVKFVSSPEVKTVAAVQSESGIAWKRTSRNVFSITVPENMARSPVRLFNLSGKEIAGAIQGSVGTNGLIVTVKSGMLASGNYLLSVSLQSGELRIPFMY